MSPLDPELCPESFYLLPFQLGEGFRMVHQVYDFLHLLDAFDSRIRNDMFVSL